MVLDLNLLRSDKIESGVQTITDSEKKRFRDVSKVTLAVDLDSKWRQARSRGDNCNRLKNVCSKAISVKKKANEPDGDSDEVPSTIVSSIDSITLEILQPLTPRQIRSVSKLLDETIEANNKQISQLEDSRNDIFNEIGNLLHPDVPISQDEEENKIIRIWGNVEKLHPYNHVDLIHMVDGYDGERGVAVAGARGYYLKGPLVFLQQAVINLALQMLSVEGFTPIYTPFFMKKEAMKGVAQLSQFDTELYKVVGRRDGAEEHDLTEEQRYLIATSEQPIGAFHMNEWLPAESLPLRYAGISTCFRQEVGSHGRDTRGIFRVHQFEKVEQFVFTSPHDDLSWQAFHQMIGNAEAFYQRLNVPYRVVSIVSGELNNAAAMKYDLEGWFPGSGAFRELVSCSNCLDYQARSLLIRYGQVKRQGKETEYVHMLNATMCAVTRVICVLLENHQDHTAGGVHVPEALRHLMPEKWRELIPFVKKPPPSGISAGSQNAAGTSSSSDRTGKHKSAADVNACGENLKGLKV